ncbi:MAG: DUF4147 domain-containing protein [Gemmatimonadaceae bacterium]|nr:DUF4147 domain-containing protein [Gemmatimonadaceae bacterium]
MPALSPRPFLDALYRDTLVALHPERAVHQTLDGLWGDGTPSGPVHLLGLGKASHLMCVSALRWLDEHDAPTVAGGVCVTHDEQAVAPGPLRLLVGDHPTPGPRSLAAADAVGEYIALHVHDGDHVLVLLSGGTSSLIGAPTEGMSFEVFAATSDALLRSGLSINQINRQRRQLSRWGGGRLGTALQARGARVQVLVISDVIGDELAAIGSGPCMPDAGGSAPPIPHHVIGSNRAAREMVVRLAKERGVIPLLVAEPLHGDVAICAERISLALLTHASQARSGGVSHLPRLICWGGEPTVILSGLSAPPGGRMQALSLTLARLLHDAGDDARSITVLAAGTDGRDGATDAAGAIVDARTWSAIRSLARTPEQDLAAFRSHDALAAVHALLPAFASGTNVNDLVIALVQHES